MSSQRLPVSHNRRAFSTWKRSKMATAKAMLSLQRRRTEARFYSRRGNGAELRSKDSFSCIVKKILSYPAAESLSIGLFSETFTFARKAALQLSEIRNKYFRRLYYSIWLSYLHSALKIQPFSSVFPSAGSSAKAFCWLFLWSFKEKSVNHFL